MTREDVEQFLRENCIPRGHMYEMVIISYVKRGLAWEIQDDVRLQLLTGLDRLVNGQFNQWLTEEMVAAVEPVCDAGYEMIREAMKLDKGKPGQPGALDALAKFFPAFAVLNPSLITALKMPKRFATYQF